MKTLLFLFLALGLSNTTSASPADTVYTLIDTMPEYPGGEKEMLMRLPKCTNFQAYAEKEEVTLRAFVRTIVNEDGSLSDFKIIRGEDAAFNKQAIEAVKCLGRFKPGIKNGKPVKVYYTIPIIYKLY
jgi:TonB family protein